MSPAAQGPPLEACEVDIVLPGGSARRITVVSDAEATDGRLPDDYVMGVVGATRTLLTMLPSHRVSRALDLGTGCGVVALALREVADAVVGSDVCARALRAARATWTANGVTGAALLQGSLADPFTADAFDLVAANPPFVIGAPGRPHRHRDTPMDGDGLVPHLIAEAARILVPGGYAVMLAAWLHTDEPWQNRVARWFPATVEVWVAQREVLSCADYVEVWLRDSGESVDRVRAERWRANLADLGAIAIGFGWVVVAKPATRRREPLHWCDDVAHAGRIPTGDEVTAEFARRRAMPDAVGLLQRRVRLAPGSELVPLTLPGLAAPPSGDLPPPTLIRRTDGWRAAEPLDPATTVLLGAEVSRTLAESVVDCAEACGQDPDDVRVSWLTGVRALAERGFVTLE